VVVEVEIISENRELLDLQVRRQGPLGPEVVVEVDLEVRR
jgi:hypothetical protein